MASSRFILQLFLETLETETQDTAPTQIIDQICSLAEERNKFATWGLLSTGICIDMHDGKGTAVGRFAAKNDADAVYFLVRCGASINNALAGAIEHDSLAKDLIKRGASTFYAMQGAAHAGDTKAIARHLPKNNQNIDAFLRHAIFGAASGGHTDLIQEHIIQPAGLPDDEQAREGLNLSTLMGAAYARDIPLIKRILDTLPPTLLNQALAHIIFGTAMAGRASLIELLIDHNPTQEVLNIIVKNTMCGAARGGHPKLIRTFMERYFPSSVPNPHYDKILYHAAMGGHLSLTVNLIIHHPNNAAMNRNPIFTTRFFRLHPDILPHAVRGAEENGHTKDLDMYREFDICMIHNYMKEKNVTCEQAFILRREYDISVLMRIKNLTFYQALAWQQSDVQGLLMFFNLCNQTAMPVEICLLIAAYLIHSSEHEKMKPLITKMPLEIKRTHAIIQITDLIGHAGDTNYLRKYFKRINNEKALDLVVDVITDTILQKATTDPNVSKIISKESLTLYISGQTNNKKYSSPYEDELAALKKQASNALKSYIIDINRKPILDLILNHTIIQRIAAIQLIEKEIAAGTYNPNSIQLELEKTFGANILIEDFFLLRIFSEKKWFNELGTWIKKYNAFLRAPKKISTLRSNAKPATLSISSNQDGFFAGQTREESLETKNPQKKYFLG